MTIEIDEGSGFCFGVTTAIKKAEQELSNGSPLYSLGDIVHNEEECERLGRLGLIAINHQQFRQLKGARVLFRAHGEPPETYAIAKENQIELIDATCPVVLKIQQRIRREYETGLAEGHEKQIVIFGQKGHAEVLGLVGQTDGHAIVIESVDDLQRIDFHKDIYLYSQTTKSLSEFRQIVETIRNRIDEGVVFRYSDTICRQVANRLEDIRHFASSHNLVFFVCGSKSSNGRVLLEACRNVNANTYHIQRSQDIDYRLITPEVNSIGICGATSTPKWLMEECREKLLEYHRQMSPKSI
ncbi:MAG: 4-hydroxy-3-methylbut-2-enyl diphosphate reductase [Bacteroidaceae bacterium]|nr:4-hydroxy-3-methylbut-2-enyl diphosphate reductase [Bacteroidaceae bacterium]